MTPPPIRYPLPTLAALVVLAALSWWGRDWLGAAGAAVRSGIDRVASGPPVPSSTEPKRRDGGIARKVLLLRDGVAATDLPDGRPVETIGRRVFADVYDVWPPEGEPTHYRIGNRRPVGWVPAGDVLPWDTRLVLIPEGGSISLADAPGDAGGSAVAVDGSPLPVIDWRDEAFRVALWEPGEPWRHVGRTGWIRADDGGDLLGVLVGRFELLELMRRSLDAKGGGSGPSLRATAVLGRLAGGDDLGRDEAEAALRVLPAAVRLAEPTDGEPIADRLARLNDEWRADAAWSGIEYRAIPIEILPR